MKQEWEIKQFEDCLVKTIYTSKIQRKDFLGTGNYPIISQEQDFINGYWNNKKDLFKVITPIVVFGDHTKVLKYIDFDFVLGADGVKILQPKNNIDSRYFYYYLMNINLESLGYARHYRLLKESKISYPKSLVKQKQIVSILDKAFKDIAKAKDNTEKNLKNTKELFDNYLQNVFNNRYEWEENTLGDVLLKTETVDPTKKPNEEFIYLDVSSVNKETKQIENANVLLGKNAPSRAKKLVKTNDVIFATVRPTHSRVALITEEYDGQVCSTGYFVLRAKDFLDNNLIYYFLLTKDFNKQMKKLQKGASYPAVTDSEVKGIIISYPKSLQEQKEIVKKLDILSAETKKLEMIYQNKLKDLEELKKSILQKAFNGEL